MDFWVKEIKNIVAKSKELTRINPVMFEKLDIHLLQKYVDDVFVAGNSMKKGVKYDKMAKAIIWSNEQEILDNEGTMKISRGQHQ